MIDDIKPKSNIISLLFLLLFIIALCGGGFWLWKQYFSGFSENDAEMVENKIRSYYVSSDANIIVKEIKMYRDPKDNYKMYGLLTIIQKPRYIEQKLQCNATLLDKGEIIYGCNF